MAVFEMDITPNDLNKIIVSFLEQGIIFGILTGVIISLLLRPFKFMFWRKEK